MLILLNNENPKDPYFYVYNIFADRFARKIRMEICPGSESSNHAFDVDSEGHLLVYSNGSDMVFRTLTMPDKLIPFMRPKYLSNEHK
jgi:hypothetical protein